MALPSGPFFEGDNKVKTSLSRLKKSKRMRRAQSIEETFSSVDEVPDFHDPFSDLNLFLFKHLKRSLPNLGFPKKWTLKLQEGLVKAIVPEFKKKFPLYRLGVSALKKAFEKLLSFSEVVQQEKEAFTQDGKLNPSFLIRENLKQFHTFKTPSYLHPYHFAHQLAMKIGECLAVIDGKRPKIEALAKSIWSIERHLLRDINPQETRSPYDDVDQVDELIVKVILEISAKNQTISEQDLLSTVKEQLKSLSQLQSFSSLDQMEASISALLAEKLYPSSPFHTLFPTHQKEAISSFLKRHLQACKLSSPNRGRKETVQRICALYTLASNLPKDFSEEQIKAGIKAIYPVQKEKRPPLSQSFYAFMAAELVLRSTDDYSSVQETEERLIAAYKEAILLPEIEDHNLLEIVIWKQIGESERLLDGLPYLSGQRIEEEIANLLLDNPSQKFSTLVAYTVKFFKKIKALSLDMNSEVTEAKIRIWASQSDMLLRWIHLDTDTPLMKLINEAYTNLTKARETPSHDRVILDVTQAYLTTYPQMAHYALHLQRRLLTLYKFCFFSHFGKSKESSLDRLLKWHERALKDRAPSISQEELREQLKEIVTKRVPLIPPSLIS